MDALLNLLMGKNPTSYIILDENLRVVRFSGHAEAFADNSSMCAAGEDIREAFPEFIGTENDLRHIAVTGLGKWKIRNLSRTSGTPFTIDITVQPAPTQSNEKLIVLIEDVTKRVELEQKLLQQSNETRLLLHAAAKTRDYYEQIIESMSDGLLVVSPSGIVRTANAAISRMHGFNKAELVGMDFSRAFSLSVSQFSHEPLSDHETVLTTMNDERIPVSISSSMIDAQEDEAKDMLLLIKDLREKRLAERKIDRLETEKAYLLEEIHSTTNFKEILGNSRVMRTLFREIEQVAGTDSTVLLLGETGTGKELVARAIHSRSSRSKQLLVHVNCAALPQGLVESELFGHEKGAFTGANARRVGRFEYASGGTILLDEVGELPLGTQAKLLRVLQERTFERVGGTQTIKVDVRVIAATNRDLGEAVETGTFRSDLFFRINVFPIHVPPLRDRKEDIPLLVKNFVQQFSHRMNKKIQTIDKKSIEGLMRYEWPGNVRELSAVVERAVIVCETDVLKINISGQSGVRRTREGQGGTLAQMERSYILQALAEAEGVIEGQRGAAIRLGINPSTLRSRMRKLGIRRLGKQYQ